MNNFGLSFGKNGRGKCERENGREEEEEEEERKGIETTFVWILVLDAMMILYGILWDLYG